MLVYDEDIDEMVEDCRKWYECPRCNNDWTNEDCEDYEFEAWPKDENLKGLTVLRIDDGKEIEYREYPERLCPDCTDKVMDGRLKGPFMEVTSCIANNDFECQVCGSKDLDFKPAKPKYCRSGDSIATCGSCNSYHFVETEVSEVFCFGYREDLDTKRFNEMFSQSADILLSEGMLIK